MVTRMADRQESPDLMTEQLNLRGTMTIRSSALSLKDRRPTRKRKLTGAWSDKNSNAEMNETSFGDSCGTDGSKKGRIWVRRHKIISSGKESCPTACKGTTTEVDVDLLPQCLVGTTPGLYI